MTKKALYGLVCSGGGARGSYQVGVLNYIHEHFCQGEQSPFQIFTGSSCGSLNTSFYASRSFDAHRSRLELEKLWLSFHVPAYHGSVVKSAVKSIFNHWRNQKKKDLNTAWSLLSPAPMKEIIRKGFSRDHLEKSFKLGTTLGMGVAATEMLSGRCCWFQEGEKAAEWNLFHSLGVKTKLQTHHMEASCSVPLFLPPVSIGEHFFTDGSVGMDKPLAAAVIMGATRILTIATDQPSPRQLPVYPDYFKPKTSSIVRLLLNRLSRDLTHDEAIEIKMLNRFYHAMALQKKYFSKSQEFPLFHDQALPSHYHPVELFTFYPSKNIRDYIGIDKKGGKIKSLKTRFLFHSKFIQELINLGYQDATARHDDLRSFFLAEKKN